jgi:hypothetical protein
MGQQEDAEKRPMRAWMSAMKKLSASWGASAAADGRVRQRKSFWPSHGR